MTKRTSFVREARAGGCFRCVEYATVLAGCLNALLIRARLLNLMPRDIEISFGGAGHMVVEASLADSGRWLFADPQFNAVVTVAGQPANAIELQRALAGGGDVVFGPSLRGTADYRAYVGERLFYFRAPLDMRLGIEEIATRPSSSWSRSARRSREFLERTFAITNCVCTHSLAAFYPRPGLG